MKPISKLLLLIITLIIIDGCYSVKEVDSLSIAFNDSRINGRFLKTYMDSVRNKDLVVPDSIKTLMDAESLDTTERLVYFKNDPQEWYKLSFDIYPCSIQSIYNKKLAAWEIQKRSFLSAKELQRIEDRFRTEVLTAAEQYGKAHHVPDSIIYFTPGLKK